MRMPDPTPVVLLPASIRMMAGDTFLAIDMMLGPPELTVFSSAPGRTATFSMTGFSTTSPESPPEAATNPSESAEPMSPATTATAQVRVPDESDDPLMLGALGLVGRLGAPPTSEGCRQRRSSGGSGAPPTGASSSSSASNGTRGTHTDGGPEGGRGPALGSSTGVGARRCNLAH